MSFASSSSIGVRDRVVTTIVSAYFEIITEAADVETSRELAISVAMIADVDRFFVVGRAVRDPFPWVPFLRLLRATPKNLHTSRSAAALRRLHHTAASMLERQGLTLVRPDDLLARPTSFEEALASLAPNTI